MEYPKGYYDRYERSKGYKRPLFINCRSLQGAELNEMHSCIHDNFLKYTSATVGDGVVIQGGNAYISEDFYKCLLEEAFFIAEGYVVEIPTKTLDILPRGRFKIGVITEKSIINAALDPTLLDPSIESLNYGQEGANVLRVIGKWGYESDLTSDSEKFWPVHEIFNGSLSSDPVQSQEAITAPVRDLVARYDRTAHGNYVSNGLEVSYLGENNEKHEHIMVISNGLCHVYGYEVIYDHDVHVNIPWAEDEKFVNNEPFSYTGTGWYNLRHSPVSRMGEVFGIKETTGNVTHGTYSGCSDPLPNQPVVSVSVVNQSGTIYVENTDYTLIGNNLDWSLGGLEPAPGSTYTVTYRYTEEITSSVVINADKKRIRVTGLVPDSVFYADYYYFIPRWDKITILRDGTPSIVKGVPDTITNIQIPRLTEGLSIANVRLQYGVTPYVEADFYRAFQMSDIQNMMTKIGELQYNVMRLAQLQDTGLKDPTTNKKNMFVDPFNDDDLRDGGLTQNALVVDGILTPFTTWAHNVLRNGDDITISGTKKLEIDNPSFTRSRKINELDYQRVMAIIKVSPRSLKVLSSNIGSKTDARKVLEENAFIPQSTLLTVTGGFFIPNELVSIFIDDIFAANTRASITGTINLPFLVPENIRVGRKVISAIGQVSNNLGTTTFIARSVQQKSAISVQYHSSDVTTKTSNLDPSKGKLEVNSFDRRYGDLPSVVSDKSRGVLNRGFGEPPTQKYIYENWKRIAHSGSVIQPNIVMHGGNTPPLLSETWEWVEADNIFQAAENSSSFLGVVSDVDFNNYIHTVTLSSPTGADDDVICVILAYVEVAGWQHTLTVGRSHGLNHQYQVRYNYRQDTEKIIFNGNSLVINLPASGWNSGGGGWTQSPEGCKIRVIRDGDIFRIYTSEMNNPTIDPNTEIIINLNSDPDLLKFRVSCPYGYGTYSQAGSRFTKRTFTSNQAVFWNVFEKCLGGGENRTTDYCAKTDPIVQTFKFKNSGFLKSVSIYITKKSSWDEETFEVMIHPTDTGVPVRDDIMAIKMVHHKDLVEGAWNEFEFEDPIFIEKDVFFALSFFTADTETMIRVSEIGSFDINGNRWVAAHSQGIGTLFLSSNRSSWSPVVGQALTIKINRFEYDLLETVNLGFLSANNVTDINFTSGLDLFSSTNVVFSARLVNDENREYIINPGKTTRIPLYTGQIDFKAKLATEDKLVSPILDGDITVTTGRTVFPSNYISRSFNVNGDIMKCWVDIYETLKSSVKVFAQTSAPGGIPVWTELSRKETESTPIGDGWVDMLFEIPTMRDITSTRIKITLDTTDTTFMERSFAENLRAYIAV